LAGTYTEDAEIGFPLPGDTRQYNIPFSQMLSQHTTWKHRLKDPAQNGQAGTRPVLPSVIFNSELLHGL
jgi:hypothetical protein